MVRCEPVERFGQSLRLKPKARLRLCALGRSTSAPPWSATGGNAAKRRGGDNEVDQAYAAFALQLHEVATMAEK